jgi:hypothetical protein
MRTADRIDRRGFLGAAAMTMAGAGFGGIEAPPAIAAPSAFVGLKQIDAGVLNVGYADVGPASGPPVILLHG